MGGNGRSYTIFQKMLAATVSFIITAVALWTYVSIKGESAQLRKGMLDDAKHVSEFVASSVQSAFWSLNWIYVDAMLDETVNFMEQKLLFILVAKDTGEIYLSNEDAQQGEQVDKSFLRKEGGLIETCKEHECALAGGGAPDLVLVKPVAIGTKTWFVLLGLSLEHVREARYEIIKRHLIWAGLFLFVGVALAYFVSRSISRPINLLAKSVQQISPDHLEFDGAINAGDEIGQLEHSFRWMLANLSEAHARLEDEARGNAAIAELARAVISQPSIKEIASLVLTHTRSLTESPMGFVAYADPQTGRFIASVILAEPADGEEPDGVATDLDDEAFREFLAPWGYGLDNRVSVLRNVPPDGGGGEFPAVTRFIGAPCLHGFDLLGHIGVANAPRAYTARDNELLERIANLYAMALQRQRALESLHQAEEKYRGIFENAVEGIFQSTLEGRFLSANPAMAMVFGYDSPGAFIAGVKNIATELYVHPEGRQEVLRELREKGQVANFEFKGRKKNGESLWASLSARLVRDDGMEFIEGMLVDITKRKHAEEALNASEQRFRNLLEDVDMVAVQGYDQERRVIYWNKASERLYGYGAVEAFGQKLENLIIPEPMREAVVAGVRNWLDKGVPIPAGELELLRKDGTPVAVYSSHVMQQTSHGRKEMYCIDVELTGIKEAHGQLLRAKEAAEAASQAKSEFLANMSHEVRTPLNGIMGMLQLLETTPLDAEQKEYAQLARQSSKRLTHLLSDILDLSRVEAGKMVFKNEPFDLKENLQQIRDLFTPLALQANLRLDLAIAPSVPRRVCGDPSRLQQVLINFVGNALKFTTGGRVFIQASLNSPLDPKRADVLFSISDTGIGIAEEKLEALFEPFVQGSEGLRRTHQGAGLGLSICKRLVELMGGSISVRSELGNGSTFSFNILFGLPESADTAPEAATLAGAKAVAGKRVLLVEDDATSRFAAMRQMEKMGYAVTAVEDGQKALEALSDNTYHVILMDIQMPVMNGLEATKAIREGKVGRDRAGLPIIALTAYAMAGDKEKLLEVGINDYLAKPLEVEELHKALRRVLGKGGRGTLS